MRPSLFVLALSAAALVDPTSASACDEAVVDSSAAGYLDFADLPESHHDAVSQIVWFAIDGGASIELTVANVSVCNQLASAADDQLGAIGDVSSSHHGAGSTCTITFEPAAFLAPCDPDHATDAFVSWAEGLAEAQGEYLVDPVSFHDGFKYAQQVERDALKQAKMDAIAARAASHAGGSKNPKKSTNKGQ